MKRRSHLLQQQPKLTTNLPPLDIIFKQFQHCRSGSELGNCCLFLTEWDLEQGGFSSRLEVFSLAAFEIFERSNVYLMGRREAQSSCLQCSCLFPFAEPCWNSGKKCRTGTRISQAVVQSQFQKWNWIIKDTGEWKHSWAIWRFETENKLNLWFSKEKIHNWRKRQILGKCWIPWQKEHPCVQKVVLV